MNDDRRAMSVQNPMSINDLMSRQQPRMTSVPPNLPPSNIRFSDGPAAAPSNRARNTSVPRDELNVGPEDEFGYELILNKNKMKKEEFNTGGGGGADDELYNDIPLAGTDDFVDPRERAAFEHNGDAGPSLPPFRPLSVGPNGGGANGRLPSIQRPRPVRTADAAFGASGTNNSFGSGGSWDSMPKMSYEELIERRKKVVEGLDKYRRRGLDVRAFPPDAPIEEMEAEYERHKRAVDVEASIQFSRKMLMACVTGLEYLNHRYDPLGLQLEGWSESVIEDIHNYDDVFERLYDKYHTSAQMPPEFELLLMVAGSAFMFHLTNSMFKSAMPGMGNPDAMRTIRRGVMGAMSGAMSGAAGGGGISGMMNGMFGAATGGQQRGGRPSGSSSQPPPRGNGPPPARTGRTPPRREMRGPSGNMDDMLNDLMDREPGEVSNRLVEEIDDILNNPSDDDRDRPAQIIQSPPRARAGPGGSISLPNPLNVDI